MAAAVEVAEEEEEAEEGEEEAATAEAAADPGGTEALAWVAAARNLKAVLTLP